MSARRAGPPASSGSPGPLPILLAVVAALAGGFAAADIRHASTTVTLIFSVVVAVVAVAVLFRWPSQRRELPAERWHEQVRSPGPPAPPGLPGARSPQPTVPNPVVGTSMPELDGDAGTNAVVQLYPAQSAQAGGPDWWKRGPVPPPAPSADARRAPAPDLSTYLAFSQIAQCPNCGAFGLDIRRNRGGSGWEFRCQSCAVTWVWRSDTPWPTTRVAPARRRHSRPPS